MIRALEYGVKGQWKKQAGEESMMVCICMEDALCRPILIFYVNQIAAGLRRIQSPSIVGDTARFCTLISFCCFSMGPSFSPVVGL